MREAEILYEAYNSDFGIEVELLGNYQMSLQRLNRSNKTHKVRGRFTPLPTFLEMTKWALGSKTKRQKFTYTFTAQTLN